MDKVVKGNIGTRLILDVGVDISAATVRKIKAMPPSGTEKEWTAQAEGTTAIRYTTTTVGDLDEAGLWTLAAYIETANFKGHGRPVEIMVMEPFAK